MILSSFKMAQKSIISFFGKTSSSEETNVEASSPQEADIPSSEHSSGPQKKKQKFEHVYQDDKWPEKWPFLTKTEKGMFCQICLKQKKRNALTEGSTNYRTSTIERHISTRDHQDAIKEDALRLGFSEVRYCFVFKKISIYTCQNEARKISLG